MTSPSALIEAFGGPAAFGRAIGQPESHARTMKARNSIPSAYWPKVVAAAKEMRLEGVTYESLTLMHAKAPLSQPASASS